MRGKVTTSQLARRAFVYVRQSTTAQMIHHAESTKRQYGLADRARALGWTDAAIDVIDEDLGRSGSTTEGRSGFARLKEGVARGEVGAIFALDVSRLARSSEDWQRLLSLCAVAEVAVVDENVVYDPADKDDKLLLDIKGTMSEAELHWIGLRMHGALQSKARRGALHIPVPTGYVWHDARLEFDPDEAVQGAVRAIFERYAVEPSAWAVVRWARATGLQFPTRRHYADGTTELVWKPLAVSRLHEVLNNPIYAGVYAYNRRPERKVLIDGEIRSVRASGRDPAKWGVRIEQAHPGYIDWDTFLKNQQRLRDNLARKNRATRGAPREGNALLPGLLLCGRCGRRMTVSYGKTTANRSSYVCGGERDKGQVLCWTVPGEPIDRAVESLFLQTMVPTEIELSLAVEREIGQEASTIERQWKVRLEQAIYEARRAERRYKAVDPDNRVVARTLERDWELRLSELQDIEQQIERAKRERRIALSEEDRARIRALARDLPKVWRSETTPQSDRKAMLRLVVEAISLAPVDVPRRETLVRLQWKTGAVTELHVPRPSRRMRLRTPSDVTDRLRALAEQGLRDEEIAERLNGDGLFTGRGMRWNVPAVKWARRREGIQRTAPDAPRSLPLPERHPDGRYSVQGTAKAFGVSCNMVRKWIAKGLILPATEPYGTYKRVQWITIDDDTKARLLPLAAAYKQRMDRPYND